MTNQALYILFAAYLPTMPLSELIKSVEGARRETIATQRIVSSALLAAM